ncbi:ATP-binding protein [Canariomyces notabilis]|uniref:ATP-binding protein n=1 Tax=Canariomyces notabilis TaxID=2074819 RepID=A0AAN6TH33_9PEZI|nr:ATP-binding protein [Canariomyces arenarius]
MSTPQTPSRKLFIQMSGTPGSGKSTLARLLGRALGGVVIDHDVLRSAFLEPSTRLAFEQAAKHAYRLQSTLAQDLMEQGGVAGIIMDSPCNFREVLDQGAARARQHGYESWYVECRVQDAELLDRRLRGRVRPMASQRSGIDRPPAGAVAPAARGAAAVVGEDKIEGDGDRETFGRWMKNPCRPEENVVVVDSTGDPEMLRDYVLERILG